MLSVKKFRENLKNYEKLWIEMWQNLLNIYNVNLFFISYNKIISACILINIII